MRFLIPTLLILLLLAVNHAVYGTGCWGYQPGGHYSSYLYTAQLLLSAYALVYTLIFLTQGKRMRDVIFAGIAIMFCVIRFVLMEAYGSRMHTSIPNQGTENLLPFFLNSFVALTVGIQILTELTPEIRLASDCPKCGYPMKQLPDKICPECGYEESLQTQTPTVT